MKEHIKKWKWLYAFYLVAIPNFFTTNETIKTVLFCIMAILFVMFYRSTVDRLYKNK